MRPAVATGAWLAAIVVAALALRLYAVDFGLPSLYDRDEPLFVLTALKLLAKGTLNPGWFGHPATTTLYVLALLDILVYAVGHALGYLPDVHAFGAALFADPTIVFLPGRLFMVLCGLATIVLTYRLGKNLFGAPVGLIAAGLLAAMPLHITYSQIIRTDMQSTVFMLLCCLSALRIMRRGERRDYLLAALWVGLATATKWPASVAGLSCMAACLAAPMRTPRQKARDALIFAVLSIAVLVAISPYLLLDNTTVLRNIWGETRPFHLGATGGDFLANLRWYIATPLRATLGIGGLVVAGGGMGLAIRSGRDAVATVVLITVATLSLICSLHLVWARWLVPILPHVAIFMALGVRWLAERAPAALPRRLAAVGLIILLVGPMLWTARLDAMDRVTDTRGEASTWVLRHAPPKATIVIEYPAFDLFAAGYRMIYPLGDLGCVDGGAMLKGQKVTYDGAQRHQGKSPSINIGSVAPELLSTCRGDYAVLSEYERYKAEGFRYPLEVANYEKLIKRGCVVQSFFPVRGVAGGPVVRIVDLHCRGTAG